MNTTLRQPTGKRARRLGMVLLVVLVGIPTLAQPTNPQPNAARRYFGMHFDFHATTDDSLVGRNLTESHLDSLLMAIKPDFIQVDCKGHLGVSSYPSKVANATVAPRFAKDPLAFYRAVTRKHGVGLYLHYSGVWDNAALARHPNWAAQKADGSFDKAKISVHGPYTDSLLIPQLRELADYGADGVWVDGDCWATVLDYAPAALAKFQAETGVKTVPRSSRDPGYSAFRDFARRQFTRYIGNYVDEVHRHNPRFRVASNWAYSSMMPEPITTNVDYLSGDLTPGNSVNVGAMEARILAAQGLFYRKPWDVMSWGFWYEFNPARQGDQKTAVHLMQEAAEVLALGGGFQAYYQQSRDASIPLHELPVMAGLSRFVRARQPFCEGSVPVPQVAMLYSNSTVKKYDKPLFSREQTYRIEGVLTALLDAQLPVEVLSEHHLSGRLNQYPVIVISQQDSLGPAFRRELLDYARQGGNLLLFGAETTRQFADELGVVPTDTIRKGVRWISNTGRPMTLAGPFLPVRVTGHTARPIGRFYESEPGGAAGGVVATETTFGQRQLTAVYADLSRDYQKHQSPKLRDFIASLTRPLLPNPLVEVGGSRLVHVVLNRLNNRLAVNLINTGGRHADPQVFTYDEVPPLTNLTVRLRTAQKPRRIVQQPENKVLTVSYANGIATITVPQLTIHSVLMVE